MTSEWSSPPGSVRLISDRKARLYQAAMPAFGCHIGEVVRCRAQVASRKRMTDLGSSKLQHRYSIGQRVIAKGYGQGIVSFVGETPRLGQTVGVTLSTTVGNCDGSLDGIRYFNAPNQQGVFVSVKDVVPPWGQLNPMPLSPLLNVQLYEATHPQPKPIPVRYDERTERANQFREDLKRERQRRFLKLNNLRYEVEQRGVIIRKSNQEKNNNTFGDCQQKLKTPPRLKYLRSIQPPPSSYPLVTPSTPPPALVNSNND